MRGLFLDNLTSLVGDVFKGVANSTSRMKESVLFHNGEEEKKYKQMEERKNKEVAKLKEELKERDKQVEERNKQIKAKEKELKTREEKIDKLKKKLDDKDGIIGELRKHNAGLKVAFDLNAGVIMQMQDWDAKIEEANLKAANFKRSRQELEETTGPEMKKVCVAVNQLRSKKQEVVANGLQMLEASAKIIGPAVAQSKNQKRRAQRERAKKGNKYCGICKDFFRLDL